MTKIQKSQNEKCWTLSSNPTNTHSAKHELWSEGVSDIDDSTGIGREGEKNPLSIRWSLEQNSSKDAQKDRVEKGRENVGTNQRPDTLVAFVRNSKGCEDTHQSVRDGWHCWGVRRTEQRQKNWSLLSGLGRLPTEEDYTWESIENLYGHEDLPQTYEQWLKTENKRFDSQESERKMEGNYGVFWRERLPGGRRSRPCQIHWGESVTTQPRT